LIAIMACVWTVLFSTESFALRERGTVQSVSNQRTSLKSCVVNILYVSTVGSGGPNIQPRLQHVQFAANQFGNKSERMLRHNQQSHMACQGRGECIKECKCLCKTVICGCGHRYHSTIYGQRDIPKGFCRVQCPHKCELFLCSNFAFCGQKRPEWFLELKQGLCDRCTIEMSLKIYTID